MSGDEEVDLVDASDQVVGSAPLRACLEQGLLHRAVAVLVVRSNGSLLLQQRSRNDLWHPGLWTLSSTGHVRKGETYARAARRELEEELGMAARLRRISKVLLPAITSGRLTEREWVSMFTTVSDRSPRIDPVELEQVEEVSKLRLARMLNGPELTPDAKILLAAYRRDPH